MRGWIVERVTLTAEAVKFGASRVCYPYRVEGRYAPGFLNLRPGESDRFSWTVPSLDDPNYDLSGASLPSGAVRK